MSDLRASVVIDLAGNLERRAQSYGQSLGRFSERGRRDLGRLSRASATLGRGLDRIANRYTALLTGAAGIGTARMLVNLEERFAMLGIAADISNEQVDALKRQIYDVASAPQIRVDPGELTSAIEQIVEMTGDLDFASASMETLGLSISATGGKTGQAIGSLAAEFQKMGLSGDEAREAMDILVTQGKAGAFTLQNLANLGSRVVTAYTAMGRKGVPAIREMGAALQVIRQGTGSSEMAATAFEALLRTLSDPKKVKLLEQKGGIQIFDPEAAKQGLEVMRPINELMVEIIEVSKGRKTLLGEVFDAEAVRAFNAAIGEYGRSGRVESLDKFMAVQADGSNLMRDSQRHADTAAAALTNLYTAWKRFADSELTAPIQALADALNSLDKEQMDTIMQTLKWGGVALGSAIVMRKVAGVVGASRRGGVTGALGEAAGLGGMGVQPVYVVNMPGGFGGKGGLPGGGKGAAAGRAGRVFSKAKTSAALLGGTPLSKLKYLGAGAMGTAGAAVTAAGAAGYGVGTLASKYLLTDQGPLGTETGEEIGDKIGEGVARVLAFFGNDEAQRAIEINEREERRRNEGLARTEAAFGGGARRTGAQGDATGAERMRGEVVVRVRAEKGAEARTERPRSDSDALGLEVETEAGVRAGGAW